MIDLLTSVLSTHGPTGLALAIVTVLLNRLYKRQSNRDEKYEKLQSDILKWKDHVIEQGEERQSRLEEVIIKNTEAWTQVITILRERR